MYPRTHAIRATSRPISRRIQPTQRISRPESPLKLLIVGANGKTGRELVRQSCELGHQVTALVHHPPSHPMHCARILQGDARNPELLDSAVRAQDAVIDTIGTRKPFLKTSLETEAARNLIAVMQRHTVQRIVAVSSLGVGDSIVNVPPLFRALIPFFFRGAMPDKEGMEAELRQSALDWTIIRPAGLTDGPLTDTAQIVTPESRRQVRRISRADLARFILQHLQDRDVIQETIGIASQ
jgi:putative NADH-flavin reductase